MEAGEIILIKISKDKMDLILDKEIGNFQDVFNFLNLVPGINCGGCGVAALSMYRWLEKNEGERPPILLFYHNKERYNLNLKYLEKGKKRYLQLPNHCVIGYPIEELDNIVSRWESEFKWNQTTDEYGMLKLLKYGKNWGIRFKRSYISEISKRLDIDLSDVCLK
jgi:hypothetical protein